MEKIKLLVNLPKGFFSTPVSAAVLRRAAKLANLRKRSWNTADELREDLAWADAVLMWSWPVLTDELLDAAPNLKFSGQIDVGRKGAEIALRRGLAVSVSRRAFSPAVAEMALTLTLNLLRKTTSHHIAMRSGNESWVQSFPDDIDGDERELTGRSVGVIGFGAVGQRFAELLGPFRTETRVFDPFLPPEIAEKAGVRLVKLPDLLKNSDVVVLCAASNSGTAHLLGKKEIALFRKSAVFVNAARAALVDTDALIERLRKNDLYAAIDVFDKEPLPAKAPIRKLPNAFLTPHRAGGLLVSVERILNLLIDDLERHFKGEPRLCPLTEKMLPGLDG